MDRSRLAIAIVIPALNEAATIKQVVEAVLPYGSCVVVDDGSTDDTASVARAAGATVVSHPKNQGYDAALDSGFRQAADTGCEAIITLDADGQHNPELLAKFVAALESGAAVALGERDRRQRFAEHVFAWYTQHRFGIFDPLCGLKAYRVEVYNALGHFDAYRSIGTELMLFAARRQYAITHIPFEVRERNGRPRFANRLVGNWRIFRALTLSFFR